MVECSQCTFGDGLRHAEELSQSSSKGEDDFVRSGHNRRTITPAQTKVNTISVPNDIKDARRERSTKHARSAAPIPVIIIPAVGT